MVDVGLGLMAGVWSALAYGSFAGPSAHISELQKSYVLPTILAGFGVGRVSIHLVGRFGRCNLGVLAIISIHLAGLGVAQTIWSAVSVFVSFAWGKIFFHEAMANAPLSVFGLTLMVLGMVGLGCVAAGAEAARRAAEGPKAAAAVVGEIFAASLDPEDDVREMSPLWRGEQETLLDGAPNSSAQTLERSARNTEMEAAKDRSTPGLDEDDPGGISTSPASGPLQSWERHAFALGVAGGVVIGVLAGTMMVCLKLSPPDRRGDQYTVSFGVGVAGVTMAALVGNAAACLLLGRSPPSFQVRVAAGPACLAGTLWTVGNYLSIVAVDSLGMAVGWPIVQCSLIVSNSWALFWYREVSGTRAVTQFLLCSFVILAGVCLLAWYGL